MSKQKETEIYFSNLKKQTNMLMDLLDVNKTADEILMEGDRSAMDYFEGETIDPEGDRSANDYE